MFKIIRIIYACLFFVVCAQANTAQDNRIVSIGSSITEWLIALDEAKSIVGVDLTGAYPTEVANLPKVGYQRTLNAEGIASLKPNWVIGSQEMGPETTLKQLKQLGIKVEILTTDTDLQVLKNNLITLGKQLNKEDEALKLFQNFQEKLTHVSSFVNQAKKTASSPSILVIIGPHAGLLTAGKNTTADWLIEQAGGVNAVSFDGYKSLSNEALVALNPDVIIIADRVNVQLEQAMATLIKKTPSIKMTAAAKNQKIMMLDATLLVAGLGPRLPDEAIRLAKIFYEISENKK